jgi:hypothetical protein
MSGGCLTDRASAAAPTPVGVTSNETTTELTRAQTQVFQGPGAGSFKRLLGGASRAMALPPQPVEAPGARSQKREGEGSSSGGKNGGVQSRLDAGPDGHANREQEQ